MHSDCSPGVYRAGQPGRLYMCTHSNVATPFVLYSSSGVPILSSPKFSGLSSDGTEIVESAVW